MVQNTELVGYRNVLNLHATFTDSPWTPMSTRHLRNFYFLNMETCTKINLA